MLNSSLISRGIARRNTQQGVIMVVALLVLVAVTLAAIALTRTVDSATLIAGNLAFKKSATRAGDRGIETAISILKQKLTDGTLDSDDTTSGYFATLRSVDVPATGVSWQSFWYSTYATLAYSMGTDQFGNTISFVIHRACANASPPGAGGQCIVSPVVNKDTGNSQEAGEIELQSSSQIYYRITVQIAGPRRTESYVQTHIAM